MKKMILVVVLVAVFSLISVEGASADWGSMIKKAPPAMSPNPPKPPVVWTAPAGWAYWMNLMYWYKF